MKIDSTLTIYVAEHCATCTEARRLSDYVSRILPHITIVLVELNKPTAEIPESVFASPTYMLDGRVIFLGNPSPTQLVEQLQGATADEQCRHDKSAPTQKR